MVVAARPRALRRGARDRPYRVDVETDIANGPVFVSPSNRRGGARSEGFAEQSESLSSRGINS